jgi:hypothetical protein
MEDRKEIKVEDLKGVALPPQLGEKVVQIKKSNVKKDKIALVGFAPSTLYEVNDLDESWHAMGMNELYKLGMKEMLPPGQPLLDLARFDSWMEIHSRGFDAKGKALCDDVNVQTPQGAAHIANLNAMPFPVYMRGVDMEKYKDVKNAIAFPFEEITHFFDTKYFTNTVSWMLGLVVLNCFKECGIDTSKPCAEAIKGNIEKLKNWPIKKIAVMGVDMMVGWAKRSNGDDALQNEYASQRPSCEYFIGLVKGLQMAGVDTEIYIPKKSSLLKKYSMYGFEELDPIVNDIRTDILERYDFIVQQEKNLTNNLNAMMQHFQNEQAKLTNQLFILKGTKSEVELNMSHFD